MHCLLEDFGGPDALQAVVNETIERATADEHLEDFFRGVSRKFLKEHQFQFMKQRLTGILLEDEEDSGTDSDTDSESSDEDDEDSCYKSDDSDSDEDRDGEDEEDEDVKVQRLKEEKKFADKIFKAHRRLFERGANERHFDRFMGHWSDACQAVLFQSISEEVSAPCPESHILKKATKAIFGPFRSVFERQARKYRQRKTHLLQRLGGTEVLQHAVCRMLMHLTHDDLLGPIFLTLDMQRLQEHQYKFLEIAFTGCDSSLGDTMAFLEKRHTVVNKRFGLTGKHFDLMLLHFTNVLQELQIRDDIIHEVVHTMEPFRGVFEKKTLAFSWCTPTATVVRVPSLRADVDAANQIDEHESLEDAGRDVRDVKCSKYCAAVSSLGCLHTEEELDVKLLNSECLASAESLLAHMDYLDMDEKHKEYEHEAEKKVSKCPSTMTERERKLGLIERYAAAAALVHFKIRSVTAENLAKPLSSPIQGKTENIASAVIPSTSLPKSPTTPSLIETEVPVATTLMTKEAENKKFSQDSHSNHTDSKRVTANDGPQTTSKKHSSRLSRSHSPCPSKYHPEDTVANAAAATTITTTSDMRMNESSLGRNTLTLRTKSSRITSSGVSKHATSLKPDDIETERVKKTPSYSKSQNTSSHCSKASHSRSSHPKHSMKASLSEGKLSVSASTTPQSKRNHGKAAHERSPHREKSVRASRSSRIPEISNFSKSPSRGEKHEASTKSSPTRFSKAKSNHGRQSHTTPKLDKEKRHSKEVHSTSSAPPKMVPAPAANVMKVGKASSSKMLSAQSKTQSAITWSRSIGDPTVERMDSSSSNRRSIALSRSRSKDSCTPQPTSSGKKSSTRKLDKAKMKSTRDMDVGWSRTDSSRQSSSDAAKLAMILTCSTPSANGLPRSKVSRRSSKSPQRQPSKGGGTVPHVMAMDNLPATRWSRRSSRSPPRHPSARAGKVTDTAQTDSLPSTRWSRRSSKSPCLQETSATAKTELKEASKSPEAMTVASMARMARTGNKSKGRAGIRRSRSPIVTRLEGSKVALFYSDLFGSQHSKD